MSYQKYKQLRRELDQPMYNVFLTAEDWRPAAKEAEELLAKYKEITGESRARTPLEEQMENVKVEFQRALTDPRYFSGANIKNRLESYFQMIEQRRRGQSSAA